MKIATRRRNYGRAGEYTPTRHSQVSCYTNRNSIATRTLPSLITCSKVKLTTNVSLNMVLWFQYGQALGAQTLTVRFAFVAGYEVCDLLATSEYAPTTAYQQIGPLADDSWGSYSHDASPAAGLQALADTLRRADCGRGCEFVVHAR